MGVAFNLPGSQGDQIGRIFALWAFDYVVWPFKKMHKRQKILG
jgi:hypothetical protein